MLGTGAGHAPANQRALDWREQVDWRRWSVVLLKPDCLQRGLVETVLARIATRARLIARRTVTVNQSQIFTHYDDLFVAPERLAPVDVAADLRRRYVGGQVVVVLARGGPGTPGMLRAMLGHYDPSRARPGTIRRDFGDDSLVRARAERRLVDNLIHTSDDATATCRDVGIWFADGHGRLAPDLLAALLRTEPD